MGTSYSGYEIPVAIAEASVWGTAVEAGAGDGQYLTGLSLKRSADLLKDESLSMPNPYNSDQGAIQVAGTLTAYLRYEALDFLIALVMGDTGAPAQQGGTSAYKTTYDLADNIDGVFATLATMFKSDVVFEYPSLKMYGFTIKAEMNKPVTIDFQVYGDDEVYDSVINTVATMANVTYPTTGLRVVPNQNQTFYCRVNTASGDALDSGDNVGITGFELSYTRPTEYLYDFSHTGGAEPSPNGHPSGTLKLNWNRYDDENAAFFAAWKLETAQKCEILFQGATIEDAYKYEFMIQLPNLYISNPSADPSGAGRIPASVEFDCRGRSAAPTGMTGVTDPFRITFQNTRTGEALATTTTTAAPTTTTTGA